MFLVLMPGIKLGVSHKPAERDKDSEATPRSKGSYIPLFYDRILLCYWQPALNLRSSSLHLWSARIADVTNYHAWLKVPIFFKSQFKSLKKKIRYKKGLFIEMKTRKQPR